MARDTWTSNPHYQKLIAKCASPKVWLSNSSISDKAMREIEQWKISNWTNLGHRQNEQENISKEKNQRFWKGITKKLTSLFGQGFHRLSLLCVSWPSFSYVIIAVFTFLTTIYLLCVCDKQISYLFVNGNPGHCESIWTWWRASSSARDTKVWALGN